MTSRKKAIAANEKAEKKTKKPATDKSEKVAKESTKPTAKEKAAESATAIAQKKPVESELEGASLPATQGNAGVLGGPKDRGIKADDKLSLPTGKFFTFERVLSLNPKSFYCAMRWDYHVQGKSPEEGKRWWANKKILVTNPANGKQAVVRAVDYGPHENTGLTISLSPGALDALGIEIGDPVEIAFADQKAPLGLIEV